MMCEVRTALHHEREPVSQRLLVLGEFHAPVKVVRGQRGVSPFQIGDVRGAMDEAHMRHRVNEQIGRRERLLSDQIAPELAREIEFDIDGERLRDIDAAVAALGRVVEFAQSGVAGPGIVPGVGAFQRRAFQRLENLDAERRFEFLEEHGQGGAHDAGTDQHDVGIRRARLIHDLLSRRDGPLHTATAQLERHDFSSNRYATLAHLFAHDLFRKAGPAHRVKARGQAFRDHAFAICSVGKEPRRRPQESHRPAARVDCRSVSSGGRRRRYPQPTICRLALA